MNTKPKRSKTSHSTKNIEPVEGPLPAYNPDFSGLFDTMLEGAMLIGFDWTYLYLNDEAARHGHGKREELLGRSMLEAYPGVEHSEIFAHYRECMEQRTPQRFESCSTFLDGTVGWYELSVRLVKEGIFVFSVDITARKEAEEVLRERERRFSRIFLAGPMPIAMVDIETGRYFDVNEASERLLEYTREELIGHSPMELMIFARPEQFYALRDELKKRGNLRDKEITVRTKSGRILTCLSSADVIQHQGGEYLLTVTRDITDRKQAEENLRESEARFRQMFEKHDAVMMLIEPETGAIVNANLAAQKFYGYSLEQLKGLNIDQINVLPPDEVKEQRERAAHEKLNFFVFPHRLASGEVRMVEVHSSPITIRGATLLFSIINDITERKQAEEKLRRSEEQLRTMYDTSPDAIGVFDTNANIIMMNPAAAKTFGYSTSGEMLGKNALEFFAPSDREQAAQVIHQIFTEGTVRNVEFELLRKDGSHFTSEFSCSVLFGADAKPEGFLAITRDITDRKQAEETVIENARQMTALVTSLDDVVFEFDEQGVYLNVWATDENKLAQPKAQILGRRIVDVLGEEKGRPLIESVKRAIIEGVSGTIEYPPQVIDGQLWFMARVSPIVDEDGSRRTASMLVRDITVRKQTEEKLRESEERFRMVADFTYDWEYWMDPGGQFVYVSPSCERITGYHPDEFLKKPALLEEIVHPDDRHILHRHIAESFEDADQTSYDFRIIRLDGEIRWLNHACQPVYGQDGRWLGRRASNRDITDRKRAEQYLCMNEARLKQSQAAGHLGHWDWDLTTNRVTYSDELFRIYDLEPSTFSGNPLEAINTSVHPDDRAMLFEIGAAVARGEHPVPAEYRVVWRDGSIHTVITELVETTYDTHGTPTATWGIVQDITVRKQTETALRESEEKYRGLIESLDAVVSMFDADGRLMYLNKVAASQFGGTVQGMVGKTINELFPEPVASRQLASIQRVFREDKALTIESISSIQGKPRWYRTSIQPIHDEQGRVVRVLINAVDIHDLKIMQQELLELNRTLEERVRERTAQVQDLYDNAPVGYHTLDAGGNFISINQTELNWLGYAREEMLGKPVTMIFADEDIPQFVEKLSQFKATGTSGTTEIQVMRKDGGTFPAIRNVSAIFDEQGNLVSSRATIVDITERKRMEDALHESEKRYAVLFHKSAVPAILTKHPEGNYVDVNEAFTRAYGYSREEMLGRISTDIGLIRSESCVQMLKTFEHQGNYANNELHVFTKSGEERVVLLSANQIELGGQRYAISTTYDVTDQKHAEQALRRTNLELERAMRVKDDFLATMRHELRTPLTGILGFSESLQLMVYGELNEKQNRVIKAIDESGHHLLTLINDILDLTKIESGKVELEITTVSLADICQASLQLTKGMAGKKQQVVQYAPPSDPILLDTDSRRLKQILVNLLSNAIKFTPEKGEVGLEVRADAAAQTLKLAVWDKGIGIQAEYLDRLFKPFEQIDSKLSREFEGTGLGLSLVHRLAQLLGGSVEVESVFGEGSRFTVTLPRTNHHFLDRQAGAEAKAPVEPAASTENEAPLILVADDNKILLDALADFFESKKYRTARVQNGTELLEKITDVRPVLILMDIQMRGMNGLEVIRHVRGHKDPLVMKVPIIVIAALSAVDDRELCLKAGASEYMSKPVKLQELHALVQKLVDHRK